MKQKDSKMILDLFMSDSPVFKTDERHNMDEKPREPRDKSG